MQNSDLWERLEAFRFDASEGTAPYWVKPARAEGWEAVHTARVIEEYRRFLYLTQVAPGEITPSEPMDRAWHMHLTFTRRYWGDLCGTVLGRPLHHDPCAGAEDMPRYNAQYADTLALYEAEFGAPPPADIWPSPDGVLEGLFSRVFGKSSRDRGQGCGAASGGCGARSAGKSDAGAAGDGGAGGCGGGCGAGA